MDEVTPEKILNLKNIISKFLDSLGRFFFQPVSYEGYKSP